MDEFEKALEQMRVDEEEPRSEKANQEKLSEERRLLNEEQEKRDLPNKTFAAHVVFRNDIEPILKTLETIYLSGKTNLDTHSSIFTGDFTEWLAKWKDVWSSFNAPWPTHSFSWQCEKGEGTHSMRFELSYSRLNIEVANNSEGIGSMEQLKNITKDIDYVKDTVVCCTNEDWTNELREKIVKLLKYPEITHVNSYSGTDINDK